MLSFFLFFAVSCRRNEVRIEHEALNADRAGLPILDANDVSTLISDSGITRYRINADRWQIFDKATPPYWNFERGIYIEKFDEHGRAACAAAALRRENRLRRTGL